MKAKETIDNAVSELTQQLDSGRSDVLKEYLECMSRFHSYSWGNVLLIYRQMPQASHVAGYRRWQEMNRFVRKGEEGIGILAPMIRRKRSEQPCEEEEDRYIAGFRTVHVFDVSQTEGEPLPRLSQPDGRLGNSLSHLEQVVRNDDIELQYEALPEGTDGYSADGRIVINESLSPLEQFSTLVHELAHEWFGHHSEAQKSKIQETEAEAVAYVVCRACGLESPGSSEYIQLYRGTSNTLSDSLSRIQIASARIIDEIHSLQDLFDAS